MDVKISSAQLVFCILGLGFAFFILSDGYAQEPTSEPLIGPVKSFGSVGKSELTEKKELDFHIRVKAPIREVRDSFDFYCRDLNQEFCNILGMRPVMWKLPINILIQGKKSDRVSGRYLASEIYIAPDDSMSLTLRVKLHDQFSEDAFAREFIRVLLLEQMLAPNRGRTREIEEKRTVVPDWIVHGFFQLIAHKRMGRPSAFFAGYIKSGQLLSVKQIFAQENPRKLDPLSLAAYEASATALVDALRTQKGGRDAFRLLLGDLALSDRETGGLLMQHFPALREVDNGLEKWWALQVAILGKRQALEFLDSEETNRMLGEALTVRIALKKKLPEKVEKDKKLNFFSRFKRSDGKAETVTQAAAATPSPKSAYVGNISEYAVYRKLPKWKDSIKRNYMDLQRLKAQGFPLYRPLFVQYELVIGRIMRGKLIGLAEELEKLEKMRESIRNTMELTTDYLNLYEAASTPEKSDAFDNYIRMRQAIDRAEPPKRKDRISIHLDELEKEFRPATP